MKGELCREFKTKVTMFRHEKILFYHACCNGSDRICVGMQHRITNSRKPVIWNSKTPRFAVRTSLASEDNQYACLHTDCSRNFNTKAARRKHQSKKHECSTVCDTCERRTPEQPATVEEEQVEEQVEEEQVEEEEDEQCKGVREILEKLMKLEKEFPACRTITQLLAEDRELLKLFTNSDQDLNLIRDMKNNPKVKHLLGNQGFGAVTDMMNVPSISACLLLKDELNISDVGWTRIVKEFNLPGEINLFQLVKYRKTITNPEILPNGRGFTYSLLDMLHKAITIEDIPCNSEIVVKLSLDAGTAVIGSKTQAELFQMDVISFADSRKNISALKSNKNSYIISLFLPLLGETDPEKNNYLKMQLEKSATLVNYLIDNPTMKIGNNSYTFKFLLCVDMKCLVEILG